MLALVFPLLAGVPAAAQECAAFIGSKPNVISFKQAAAQLPRFVSQKDEFETTAAFMERQHAAAANVPSNFIIRSEFDQETVSYNADSQHFEVKEYRSQKFLKGVDRYTPTLSTLTRYTPGGYRIAVETSQEFKKTGTYNAKNVFGTEMIVTVYDVVTQIVFESDVEIELDSRGHDRDDGIQISPGALNAPVPPDRARQISGHLNAAIVVKPKSPFYVTQQGFTVEPKLDNPTKATAIYEVIYADIQCVLLLDGEGIVLAATEAQ